LWVNLLVFIRLILAGRAPRASTKSNREIATAQGLLLRLLPEIAEVVNVAASANGSFR